MAAVSARGRYQQDTATRPFHHVWRARRLFIIASEWYHSGRNIVCIDLIMLLIEFSIPSCSHTTVVNDSAAAATSGRHSNLGQATPSRQGLVFTNMTASRATHNNTRWLTKASTYLTLSDPSLAIIP